MLIEVDSKTYFNRFSVSPHPYVSQKFVEINAHKVDKLIYILDAENNYSIALLGGVKDHKLLSPFSAPFGGFHFKKDNVYVSEIEGFINELVLFLKQRSFSAIELTLPPEIYHISFNAKLINTLIRCGFNMSLPEITNWIDLKRFKGSFENKSARKYINQALKNELQFSLLNDIVEQKSAFEIIRFNRAKFGRPLYMSFDDLLKVKELWPIDFFGVYNKSGVMLAGGVFYRGHSEIIQGIFWGDNELGRPLRAIDFLSLNIWNFYKELGYYAIDLGISTEKGIPNEGLIRFKESHDCYSSPRFSFDFTF